jgi:uncharacterized protein (DUF983 family)
LGPDRAGERAVMADAVEAAGQDVQEETADDSAASSVMVLRLEMILGLFVTVDLTE